MVVATSGLLAGLLVGPASGAAGVETLFGESRPVAPVAADTSAVTLGTEVTATHAGRVLGVRVYQGAGVGRSTSTAGLYSDGGTLLSSKSFEASGSEGWQTVTFDDPVEVDEGDHLTTAVLMPQGRYISAYDFAFPVRSTSVVATRGVYSYGAALHYPSSAYRQSNYFVDLVFEPTTVSTPPAPTASPTTTPTTSPTSSPPTTGGNDETSVRDLPKIPWNGGPAYWGKFAKPAAAGWTDPSFFPVGVWWSGISTDAEVQFDKNLGLNFYTELDPATDYRLIEQNGMYWVGESDLQNLQPSSRNWVGSFLDDEVDGRFEPASAGFEHLQKLADAVPPSSTGRFRYANFTSSVLTYDRVPADAQRYVNGYTDAVSVDQYFYSVPQCDWPVNWSRYIVDIPKDTCRTSHSYGLMVDALADRDISDGQRQALFNFVENASPYGNTNGHHDVGGPQIKGAVMASLIHGARGIIWFNQQFEGSCTSGNYFRRAQVEPTGCAAANTAAAREVNQFVKRMAPVLNTQSVDWRFGDHLDTMLKVKDGYAYVFAMTDGTTGARTFRLPAGLKGTEIQVLDEGRTLPVASRTFTDTFSAESTYHVYKVPLA